MSVIEAPVREQTTITVEPNRTQRALQKMLQLVKDGHWCRNEGNDGHGRHCARGLAWLVRQGPYWDIDDALDRAIDSLPNLSIGEKLNGGYFRGSYSAGARVASYSNTRKDETEIIAWFERAIALA